MGSFVRFTRLGFSPRKVRIALFSHTMVANLSWVLHFSRLIGDSMSVTAKIGSIERVDFCDSPCAERAM